MTAEVVCLSLHWFWPSVGGEEMRRWLLAIGTVFHESCTRRLKQVHSVRSMITKTSPSTTTINSNSNSNNTLHFSGRRASQVSFNEAMELAYFGAKVIHPKTMQPAVSAGVPIFIKNTFNPDFPGTRIFTSSTATKDRRRVSRREYGQSCCRTRAD